MLYCLEGVDHPGFSVLNLVLPPKAEIRAEPRGDLLGGVTVLRGRGLADGEKVVDFTAIPYYAWQNRGIHDMTAWLIEDPKLLAGRNLDDPLRRPSSASTAHRRSRFAAIDPVYDTTQVAPPPDRREGPPWLYGDGELETWRLHVMRQRSRAVCRHVGYPGEFHEPSAVAVFRRTLPAGEKVEREIRLTAVGAVQVSLNGTTLLKAASQAQPHAVKLPHFAPGARGDLRIEVATTNGEPPAILIADGPASTARAGWEWSADGRNWGPVRAFPQTASGVPPHRAELPVVEVKPVAVDKAGYFDFGRTILARVSFRCAGSPVLVVGESLAEVGETRPAAHEQRTDLQATADGRWTSRHLLAFRYLNITGSKPTDVRAESVAYPVQYRGRVRLFR